SWPSPRRSAGAPTAARRPSCPPWGCSCCSASPCCGSASTWPWWPAGPRWCRPCRSWSGRPGSCPPRSPRPAPCPAGSAPWSNGTRSPTPPRPRAACSARPGSPDTWGPPPSGRWSCSRCSSRSRYGGSRGSAARGSTENVLLVVEARGGVPVLDQRVLLPAQFRQQPGQVLGEQVGEVLGEAVAADHPQHRQVLTVRREGVGGHQPAVLPHPPRHVEDVVGRHLRRGGEGEDGQLVAPREQPEVAERLDACGQPRGHVTRGLLHGPIALPAQPQERVVLRHHLRA